MSTVVELHPDRIDARRVGGGATAGERSREMTSAIGMIVALAAWGMMFAALMFVYLGLRSQARSWPPPGIALPLALPAINTAVIVGSSVALALGLKELRLGSRRAAIGWTALTFVLGVGFVALQLLLWRGLWQDGITFHTGTVGTVVYALTSLHAVHVLFGLAALAYLLFAVMRAPKLSAASRARNAGTLRLCGMFWHFVDVVWLIMFVSMFLI